MPSLPWICNSSNDSETATEVKIVNPENSEKTNSNNEALSSFSSSKRPDLENSDSSLLTFDSTTLFTSSHNNDMRSINKGDDDGGSNNKKLE